MAYAIRHSYSPPSLFTSEGESWALDYTGQNQGPDASAGHRDYVGVYRDGSEVSGTGQWIEVDPLQPGESYNRTAKFMGLDAGSYVIMLTLNAESQDPVERDEVQGSIEVRPPG